MLVICPGTEIAPAVVSFTVFTTLTLLLLESNARTVLRLGEIAINPGELPAPISPARGKTSYSPLMITSPPAEAGPETLCEAKTRSVSPLGGFGTTVPPPQEIKPKLATSKTDKSTGLFKRQAPNCRKTRDLCAK
jgi:hypothetical protein